MIKVNFNFRNLARINIKLKPQRPVGILINPNQPNSVSCRPFQHTRWRIIEYRYAITDNFYIVNQRHIIKSTDHRCRLDRHLSWLLHLHNLVLLRIHFIILSNFYSIAPNMLIMFSQVDFHQFAVNFNVVLFHIIRRRRA